MVHINARIVLRNQAEVIKYQSLPVMVDVPNGMGHLILRNIILLWCDFFPNDVISLIKFVDKTTYKPLEIIEIRLQ